MGDGRVQPLRVEGLFRSLLDAAPDAMVIVDAQARIVLTNRQVVHLFGYEPDELIGQAIEVLVPARFRGDHARLRDGFLAEPSVRPMGSGRRLFAMRKDGSEFPVEISLSPLETQDGVLVSAAVRDISERVRMQAESDRVRDELIATVSHELRTPLTSIIGYVELLRDLGEDQLGDAARRMLAVIERNANRELRLVNDLLDLGFLDDPEHELRELAIAVAGIARAAVDGARVQARARGVTLSIEVDDPLLVLGDPQRLGQVLDNLIANAIKFTPPGGSVVVGGTRSDATVTVEVRDTGQGIAAGELPLIFDRLYRASRAVQDQVPGVGLGLSIARSIVEAHGGTISADSVVGEGTTMRVTLPAATVAGPV